MQLSVRKDLIAVPRGYQKKEWVVKDPISFAHFMFSNEELFLLNLFDGRRSLEEIRRLWQAEYQTKSLTEKQLQSIVRRFVQDRLVKVGNFGIGSHLHAQEESAIRSRLSAKLSSPLVIKLGGIDPGEILDLLWLPGQLLFSRLIVLINLLLSSLVFVYFLGHFEEISTRAATMADFFSPKNVLLMIGVIAVVKVIHELGHAIACRKFGGECFEIGVLLLAFMPTLYCDVTDSWMFREKWKRIMVAFAGIYIEILLAALCAVLWLLTGPGLANSIFFNVAMMCSLNTLFINGNPLLKYDGYYILSDLLDRPNLQQKSQAAFKQFQSSLFFTWEKETPAPAWLTLFGGLSAIYRWFVVISIVTGVYVLMKSFESGKVAEGVALVLISLTGFRMLKQRTMQRATYRRRLNLPRALASTLAIALAIGIAVYFPLPSYVYCNLSVESVGATAVYASNDGKLQMNLVPYSKVQKNDVLAVIENEELAQKIKDTKATLVHLKERSVRLQRQMDKGVDLASELKLIQSEISQVDDRLQLMNLESENLIIRAEIGGSVRPIDSVQEIESAPFLSVFEPANRNCFVARGQQLFSIESNRYRLVSYLGEKDVEFIEVEQEVEVVFNQNPHQQHRGQVEEIIEIDVQLDSLETERSGLETYIDQTGETKTLQTPYRVIVLLEQIPDSIRVGAGGRARINVPQTTLVQKIWFVLDRWWKEQNY